jgi:hypothetical protein
VGTSTGAIQAVSLGALRYTLDQCEGTYTKLGHKVRGRRGGWWGRVAGTQLDTRWEVGDARGLNGADGPRIVTVCQHKNSGRTICPLGLLLLRTLVRCSASQAPPPSSCP